MIDDTLRHDIEAIAAELGCEIFSMDFQGGVFKIVLDRLDGGVTIDDCTQVSRQVSPLLDVADFASKRYTLEVSSPGLNRPLRSGSDYQRFQGSLAKITWTPSGASNRTDVGRILAYRDENSGTVLLELESSPSEPLTIPLNSIQTARLEIEL